MDIRYLEQKSIYFCGIGGIGVSALAKICKDCFNCEVSGSDLKENKNTEALKKKIHINLEQIASNLNNKKIDLFVYSSSIKDNNEEMKEAKRLGIETMPRGVFLSKIANLFNKKIAIAGTHGKTTTTTIVHFLLKSLNLKPTILVGGIMLSVESNCEIGNRDYLVIESDESDGTFNNLEYDFGIVTSIEKDHMDFYKTEENLIKSFYKFVERTNNKIIICNEYKHCKSIIKEFRTKVISYGFEEDSDIFPFNIRETEFGYIFDVFFENKILFKDFYFNMFGKANILNLLASIGVLIANNLDLKKLQDNCKNLFSEFKGIQNRFQIESKINNHLIVNDYAHNPRKIESVIDSLIHFKNNKSQYKGYKNVLIFEPHRYSRLRDLMEDFREAVKLADKIWILDIYSASEPPIEGITSENCVRFFKEKYNDKEIKHIKTDPNEILSQILLTKDDSIFLYTSAGNTNLTKEIIDLFHSKKN